MLGGDMPEQHSVLQEINDRVARADINTHDFSELKPPGENETVIGTIDPEQLRFYVAWSLIGEDLETTRTALIDKFGGNPNDVPMDHKLAFAKIARQNITLHNVMGDMFWETLRRTFDVEDDLDIGFRSNGTIVTFKSSPVVAKLGDGIAAIGLPESLRDILSRALNLEEDCPVHGPDCERRKTLREAAAGR